MKRANYYILFALLITVNLIVAVISYSQWTICGDLAGIEGRSTVSVVDENTAWVTGGSSVNTTYRTTNGGSSWTVINTAGISPFFCLWAKDANTLFAGDNGGSGIGKIYKTTNGGNTWTVIDSAGDGIGGIKFSLSMPSFGVAFCSDATDIIFFKTRDGGNTWSRSSIPLFPGYDLSISGYNVIDSLFYSMGTTTGVPSIIMTTNGGTTYDLSNIGLPSIGGNFTRGIAFKEDKLTGIAGATSLPVISRTTNGGLNWTNVSLGNYAPNTASPVMRWIEGTNTCYLTSPYSSGILKSINGGMNWTEMSTAGLRMFNMDTKRIGTTVYGYAVSFVNGSTNVVVKAADPIAGANKRFFAHCQTLNPKYFTKGFLFNSGNHSQFGPGNTANYGAMEFDNTGKLYCINSAVINSPLQTVDTATGVLTTLGLITGLTGSSEAIASLAFNPENNKMYFTSHVDGEVYFRLYTLNLSSREATFIGGGDANLTDIAINNSGECYGTAAIGLIVKVNLSTGSIEIIGDQGYNSIGFRQGLCFDRETETLWLSGWNIDSNRAELRTVNLVTGHTTLVAPFNPEVGRIVGLSIPFASTIGIHNISSQVPDEYSLKQNYPNPFNPVTNLEFGISDLGFVSLKVFDILGKEIATLVNTKLAPGTYKYDFDGSNLSSGVYFYKLEADGFVDTKKMYLVK